MTKTAHSFPLLKFALLADAVASGATGLLMAAGASYLTGLLGLSADLLLYSGLFLLPYALAVAYVGSRTHIKPGMVWPIIVLNILWTIDSFILIARTEATALGMAFVTFQALVVFAFAVAQIMGIKRQKAEGRFQAA
jgi:hypothetical protein